MKNPQAGKFAGVCSVTALLLAAVLSAQAPAGQGREGRGQGRGPRGAAPLNFEDRTGFKSIFDGTMKGWDGDPAYWKAEEGCLSAR